MQPTNNRFSLWYQILVFAETAKSHGGDELIVNDLKPLHASIWKNNTFNLDILIFIIGLLILGGLVCHDSWQGCGERDCSV